MAATAKLLPSKRRLTFLLFIVLLFAVFFFGFNYYYIPANKEGLNKYAFLTLENIKRNILARSRDNARINFNLYKNNIDSIVKYKSTWKKYLCERVYNNNCNSVLDSLPSAACFGQAIKYLDPDPYDSTSARLESIINENFIYSSPNHKTRNNYKKPLITSVPAKQLVSPLIQKHYRDLFRYFLLLDICKGNATVIYKDSTLNIGREIVKDSLLLNFRGTTFPEIRDIRIEAIDCKMFYIPFNLDDKQLVLCGFVKTKVYKSKAHLIPVTLIYPIVIILLLLIIGMPLIKIYLIGQDEFLKLFELVQVTVSIFFGSSLITLIIIQVILLKDGDVKAQKDLDKLSKQIDSEFTKEITQAYRQLSVFDSLVKEDQNVINRIKKHDEKIVLRTIIKDYFTKYNNESIYYYFDRIAWVDSAGQQFIKAQRNEKDILFTKVNERKYYQLFARNRAYYLPHHSDSIIGIEPVYNWINGEFRFIISKRSWVPHASIVTLSTPMPSVTNAILPAGFGFCIIDEEGNVQVHSEKNRNLNENFLEQTLHSSKINEAIESRQRMFYSSLFFYGRKNAANISPISGLPFYLITYYDKGYVIPINMRILIFSLVFSLASYLLTLLIWLVIFWRRYYSNPFLYSPIGLLRWIIPKKSSSPYYKRCIFFLAIYVISILSLIFLSNYTALSSNYLLLLIIIINPINVVGALIVIIYSPYKHFVIGPNDAKFTSDKINFLRKKSKLAKKSILIISFFSLVLILFSKAFKYQGEYQFLFFQSIFIILLISYNLFWPRIPEPARSNTGTYREWYALLVGLLVVALAVLPAALYSWYPHNQEILQSVKKQQLFMAKAVQYRRDDIKQLVKDYDTSYLPHDFYNDMQYKKGIYTLFEDTCKVIHKKSIDANYTEYFEKFYFDFANNLSNEYYDPQFYPALQDSSSDGIWHWSSKDKKGFSFWYTMPPDLSNNRSSMQDSTYALEIRSKIPERFYFFTLKNPAFYFLIILLFSLLYGLYKLIGGISDALFLQKYIRGGNDPALTKPVPPKLMELYFSNSIKDAELIQKLKNPEEEFHRYLPGLPPPENTNLEKELILTTVEYRGCYDFIWNKCSAREKYLLYGFAKYGLMNFKDRVEIYLLLQRGLLIIYEEEIRLFNVSFRAYILRAFPPDVINALNKKNQQNSAWHSFRTPFLIILLAVASFIFFTQEGTWQRIIALITGLSTSIPFLFNFFSSSGAAGKK